MKVFYPLDPAFGIVYPSSYPYPPKRDFRIFAAEGSGDREDGASKGDAVKAIATVIVDNRAELINKLDELKIACSCGLHEATEKDLSDIIVENIGNGQLRHWIGQKTGIMVSGVQQNKDVKEEYKNLVSDTAIKYRAEREKVNRNKRTTNTLLIAGVSIAIVGVIYYVNKTKNKSLS